MSWVTESIAVRVTCTSKALSLFLDGLTVLVGRGMESKGLGMESWGMANESMALERESMGREVVSGASGTGSIQRVSTWGTGADAVGSETMAEWVLHDGAAITHASNMKNVASRSNLYDDFLSN